MCTGDLSQCSETCLYGLWKLHPILTEGHGKMLKDAGENWLRPGTQKLGKTGTNGQMI